MRRNHQARARMPARAVQHQQHLFVRSRPHLHGEVAQRTLEEREAHARREVPLRAPGSGMDKAGEVAPAVARMNHHRRTLPPWGPHPPHNRFEPDTMLVHRPHLDLRLRMRLRQYRYLAFKLFLKAACSWGVAALSWRGRGVWLVQPMRRRHVQAVCTLTRRPKRVLNQAATVRLFQMSPCGAGSCTTARSSSSWSGESSGWRLGRDCLRWLTRPSSPSSLKRRAIWPIQYAE